MSIAPNNQRIPHALLDVAKICGQKNRNDCCGRILKTLHDHYPQSPEAALAEKMTS
jgi:TolA-binding protein